MDSWQIPKKKRLQEGADCTLLGFGILNFLTLTPKILNVKNNLGAASLVEGGNVHFGEGRGESFVE